ncbi:unnamed protein product [Echinostoma caproni]|uniref:Sterile alpha motif domain-containing protein 14 n=1 Tax=Echinostoma caproni TaxID=27848 RepID=A0A183ASY5_9TREM|nr:unnamed protein product [Echinostoma caproni]
MKVPCPEVFEDGDVWTFLEEFEDVKEIRTDRGKLTALRLFLKDRTRAVSDAAERNPGGVPELQNGAARSWHRSPVANRGPAHPVLSSAANFERGRSAGIIVGEFCEESPGRSTDSQSPKKTAARGCYGSPEKTDRRSGGTEVKMQSKKEQECELSMPQAGPLEEELPRMIQ